MQAEKKGTGWHWHWHRASVVGIVGMVHVVVWLGRTHYVNEPYMDEVFHVPQTQRYCKGDFVYWDPMITTFPGLYLVTAGPAWLLVSSLERFGVQVDAATSAALCSTTSLRLANGLLFGCLCALLSFGILSKMNPKRPSLEIALNTLAVNLFPVYFFTVDLFYTDAGSLTMILLSFFFCLHGRHHMSALAASLAVLFRQTNIIWAAFVLAYDVYMQLNPENKRKEEQEMSLLGGLWLNLRRALAHRVRLMKNHFGMIALVLAFVAFVHKNGGRIVVGDPDAHRPSLHLVQFLYCSFVIAGAYFAFHYEPSRWIGMARAFLSAPRLRKVWLSFKAAMLLLVCFVVVHKWTRVHPYILADNRHITFTLWRRVLQHERVRWALVGPYAYAAVSINEGLKAAGRPPLVVLAFWCCLAASVCLSLMMEFRYFIVPFFFHAFLGELLTKRQALVTIAAFAVVNLVMEMLFEIKGGYMW